MLRVVWDGGVLLEKGGKSILLDPQGLPRVKPNLILVSHAHRDHYRMRVLRLLDGVPKVMSKATRDLIDPRGRLRNVVLVEPRKEVEVSGIKLEIFEAGHVLGSLQVRVDLGESVVFTGDFNLERRVILRPAPILQADVLVMDATYGHPKYSFPPRRELYRRLIEAVREGVEAGQSVLVAARPLGTAQEVTALLSLSAHYIPLVEGSIAKRNALYEKYGEVLGNYAVLRSRPPAGTPAVVSLYSSWSGAISCTGWALDGGIPLSSHSDFKGLIEYVRRSGADVVYVAYGFTRAFASYLRRTLGLEAHALT